MAADQGDAIDAAIQSAETLFANLLDRSVSGSLSTVALEMTDQAGGDPEQSLAPNQSLTTIGAASLDPAHLTAQSHAVLPLELESIDPRQSLTALVSRSSTSLTADGTSTYDQVCKTLRERERDVELAARIGQVLLRRNELLEADLSSVAEQRHQLEQQVAQLSHVIGQKEELLKLYARDAHEKELTNDIEVEGGESSPAWVHALAEECRELRESNMVLKAETMQLRRETADIEQKEKELVQNCLEQFTEAKRRLNELRDEMDNKQQESLHLQIAFQDLSRQHEEQLAKNQQLVEEGEVMREQLADAHSAHTQLTNEMSELQERYQENSVLLKETRDELTSLKEVSSSGDNGEHAITDQESIVREIEEVLRKELIAASTLPERPRSPNHYARQRTMVVMETVRAATMAQTRRRERLAAEAEKVKGEDKVKVQEKSPALSQSKQGPGFSPLAASSPGDFKSHKNIATGTVSMGTPPVTPRVACPPSPILSDTGSTMSFPEEHIRYRNQPYVAPEKLQIVKPMEGSVTLLKWKLLATPQLGGTKSFFSDASRPGVHLKKWKAGTVHDSLSAEDTRMKSLSVNDLSRMNASFPQPTKTRISRKESVRNKNRLSAAAGTAPHQGVGMNDLSGLMPSTPSPHEPTKRSNESSTSLLSSVGSFLGSGWSKLTGLSSSSAKKPPEHQPETHHENSDGGLAGLL